MTFDKLIIGSIARFNHAKKTLKDLAPIWFEQSNKIVFKSVSNDPDEAHTPELPEDNINMPLLAGDIFHSLRCSLEYIYRALYIIKIGSPPDKLQFPSSRKGIDGKLKEELKALFDRHEHTIAILAAANNQDKHRLLLFAVAKLEPMGVETVDGKLTVVSKATSREWKDATEPQQFNLGQIVRPRYVLVIEKHLDQPEISLSINDLQELIEDLRICLETIRGWIIGTNAHAR